VAVRAIAQLLQLLAGFGTENSVERVLERFPGTVGAG
jgi:hypothetical protein